MSVKGKNIYPIPEVVGGRVLIRAENLKVSEGGIHLPPGAQSHKRPLGEVLGLGKEFTDRRDDVKVGDLVFFDSQGATTIYTLDGEPLLVLHAQAILAVAGRGSLPRCLPASELVKS